MKWFVIILLSLLGLLMGYITLLPIGLRIEQLAWMLAFVTSSFCLYKFGGERRFLSGLVVGLLACALATGVHLVHYGTYVAAHRDIAAVNSKLDPGFSPYLALVIIELTKSIFYSFTSGIFAVVVGAGLKKVFEG